MEFGFYGGGGEVDVGPDVGVSVGSVLVRWGWEKEGRGGEGGEYVIESLKASTAWPYFLFRGQPISWYNVSMGVLVFSATCRIIEATILPLLNRSSHFTMSSAETRRFERSI